MRATPTVARPVRASASSSWSRVSARELARFSALLEELLVTVEHWSDLEVEVGTLEVYFSYRSGIYPFLNVELQFFQRKHTRNFTHVTFRGHGRTRGQSSHQIARGRKVSHRLLLHSDCRWNFQAKE